MKQKKRFLKLLIVLLLPSFYSMAQYQPTILPDMSIWKIAHKQLPGNIMGKIVVASNDSSEYSDLYFSFLEGIDSIYAGKVKEDILEGKLWYIEPNSTNEELIFNLDLHVNDTFMNWTFPDTYMQIDSIYEFEGRKYIEFDALTAWNEPIRFIEGVGPNTGLIWAWHNSGVLDPYAVCKYESEVLVYTNGNPNFNDCEFDPTDIENYQSHRLIVFPNPAQDQITIRMPDINSQEVIILITDLSGRVILKTTTFKKELTLNISKFGSGIYLLNIKVHDQTVYNQKIIIN